MKNILQLVLFVGILVGAFWVGLQWGNQVSHTDVMYKPLPPSQPSELPPSSSSNVNVSGEVLPNVSPTLPEISETPESSPTLPDDLPKNTTEKITTYTNANFGYGFDMPANVYYS